MLIAGATTQEHWFLGIVNDAKNVSGNSIGTALALTGSKNTSSGPQFELNVARNVTIAVGQTAFLHCRVYQLGDKEPVFFTTVENVANINIKLITFIPEDVTPG
ncbi:hypothetical protein QAD02_017068 [Eretmocerus hayati]|uniref:Uncharacterized protein n=1 Tax=Eretmocerus hayati TaxID=131215 RepID=A0ACC2PEP8_9HYME|nr:hypothetical protein QAD02_017068 [Eretmocerus hayati]